MGFDGFEELSWVRRQQNDCERRQISEPEVQHDQVAGVARQQGAQSRCRLGIRCLHTTFPNLTAKTALFQ